MATGPTASGKQPLGMLSSYYALSLVFTFRLDGRALLGDLTDELSCLKPSRVDENSLMQCIVRRLCPA